LQDDIVTLRGLLRAKSQVAADLKARLGISPMNELRLDLHHGIQSIKESSTSVHLLLNSSSVLSDIAIGLVYRLICFVCF
jgi:hypothetical protein